jgi:hypothetical protein
MSYVRRITLFKIPSESDITAVLKAYDILKETNKKVCLASFYQFPTNPVPISALTPSFSSFTLLSPPF